jgi:2-oxoglutarate ferredoxin oxidoreductase subunit alpha
VDRSITNILIGGKAGEGVKKAAQVVGNVLCRRGMHVVQADDYQSLIRGGHNFSVVCCSPEEVHATYEQCDVIICFDKRSLDEHRDQLKPGGLLFFNSDESSCGTCIPLPLTSLMKKHYSSETNVGLAAVGIMCALLGLTVAEMRDIIRSQFKRNLDENAAYAEAIHALVQPRLDLQLPPTQVGEGRYLSGNQAIGLGAWYAGLDFYFSYPMTPASSLLHYLASKQKTHGIYAIHAESELAAINMAIGAAMAGCRSAVGSSGGGFALMQEGFSLAGMVEAPLLCVLSSRPGPATGVSTYSAQEDLFFALHQGHGEFPRVVASPDSVQRAFSLAAELLSLAWKIQTPVILLTEKQLSEGMTDACLNPESLPDAVPDELDPGPYERYAITESGISPMRFPGRGIRDMIKWSSHEHLPNGLRTDNARAISEMKDKRHSKQKQLEEMVNGFQTVAEYGEGEFLVFAYGSTVLELREAMKHCSIHYKIVAPIYLEPFPLQALQPYRGRRAVVVEHNASAAFAEFLTWKLGLTVQGSILKYDGRAFDPIALARKLEEAFHA